MLTTTPQKTSCHGEWTTPVRVRVLERLSLGYNKSEVSHQTGVQRQAIQEGVKKPFSRRLGKQCSGCSHSLTPTDIRHIIYVLWRYWEGRRLCWRRLGQESDCSVSERSIQRALTAEGYTRYKACKRPFINWNAQKARLAYSSKHLHQLRSYWPAHIYGDEVTFDTSHRGSVWVTRLSSERYHKDCIQHTFNSGRASVPICGAISHKGKSSLVFLKPTGEHGITADNYHHQVLVPIVSAAFHNSAVGFLALPECQFVKDQAP